MTEPSTKPVDPTLLERLADLHTAPTTIGPPALAVRRARVGDTIAVRSAPAHSLPAVAAVVRQARALEHDTWPEVDGLSPGDRIVVAVEASSDARARYVAWLRGAATQDWPEGCSVAPCSAADGALHRLWCVAATRLVLPASVAVEARHDLLGIRLAQLALGMGADTLSGPIDADRVLPLAGIPRPTESTRDGLCALVRHAGGTPVVPPTPDEAPKSAPAATERPTA